MIHDLHFTDSIAMVDQDGAGEQPATIEGVFEDLALLEQRVLAVMSELVGPEAK